MTAQKRTPVKKETKKEKIVEHTLTSSKIVKDKVELKPHQKPVSNFLRQNDISIILSGAGCAKDFVQMYRAIEGLKNKEFEKNCNYKTHMRDFRLYWFYARESVRKN